MNTARRALVLMVAFGLALVSGLSAQAAPQVTIISPADGSTISRSATPNLSVTGVSAFDTPEPTSLTLFLERQQCSNETTDLHVLTTADYGTPSNADGCALTVAVAGLNDAFAVSGTYNTQDGFPSEEDTDGLPFALDATKSVTGTLALGGALYPSANGVGQLKVDFTLRGKVGTSSSAVALGSAAVTEVLLPNESVHHVNFQMQLPASVDKKDLTSAALTVYIHGQNVGSTYTFYNGQSSLTIPGYTASFTPSVHVSIDSATFAKPIAAALSPDQSSYSLSIPTPGIGSHTVYVRAVQGGVVSDPVSSAFTVTA